MTPRKPLSAIPLPLAPFSRMPQEGGFSPSNLSAPETPPDRHFAEIARHFAAIQTSAAHWKIDWFVINAGICPAYRSLPCLN